MLDNKEFEDKAWSEMLNILDKEMPEKKPIIWWRYGLLLLLFIPIGVGTTLCINNAQNKVINDEHILVQQIASNEDSRFSEGLIDGTELQDNKSELSSTHKVFENNSNVVFKENKNLSLNETISSEIKITTLPFSSKPVDSDMLHEQNLNANSTSLNASIINQKTTNINAEVFLNPNQILDGASAKSKSLLLLPTNTSLERPEIKMNTIAQATSLSLDYPAMDYKSILNNNITANKIYPNRRVDAQAFARLNYYTQNIGGLELGVSTNIGHQRSPWSFSTGISYEKIYFTELSNSLEKLQANDFEETIELGDTNSVAVDPVTNIADENSRFFSNQSDASFLNIPLLFHYRINRFNIGLGINNSFLIQSNSNQEAFVNNSQNEHGFNTYRVGFSQSLDYRINSAFTVGIDANIDLSGLKTSSSFLDGNNANVNLHKFGFKVGYQFNLSK